MKASHLFLFSILIFSVFGFRIAVDDDDPLKKLMEKMTTYLNEYPQEKVHIHTDRPYYSVGDSIWFKAYIVNSEKNELSGLSRILYVDLINEKDSLKHSLRLPVTAGLAWGDFVLSDSLSAGNYRIRAYTNWIRNFGEEFYFDKIIQVGDSFGNRVIGNAAYSFSKNGERENVKARISYTDMDGRPLAGREVSYSVDLDARNIAKGKGSTDAQGNLEIEFTNSRPFVLKSGKISTILKLDQKTSISRVFPIKTTSAEIDVQFFPESGQLVNGIRSNVGFKAVGADGLGRNISGLVIDKDGKEVASLKSEHVGMGVFTITPQANNKYTAVVKLEDGNEKRLPLPAVAASGYVLTVRDSEDENISVKIDLSPDLQGGGEVTLVAQSNGAVKYAARQATANTSLSALIPKNRFLTGIVQLTLFSPGYQPVAERLLFLQNEEELNVSLSTDKPGYRKREKVRASFETTDKQGKPAMANFSVAVTNESKIPFDEDKETTILSNLLLSSDLQGYIEKPNYYFRDKSQTRARHLDILLLTQGWRRFTWKNVVAGVFPSLNFQPEKTISISGTVKTLGGKPVAGGKVTVLASRGSGMLLDTLTDSEGRFRFDNLVFNDSTRFVVQARNAKDKKNVEIELDRIPPQLVTKSKNTPDIEINVNSSILPYLKIRQGEFEELRKHGLFRRNIMLDEVRIVESQPRVRNSANLNGAGNADAVISRERLENCISLDQCLLGVAGVIVQNGIAYSTRSMGTPMQLIVDGMYMEPDYLSIIHPSEVESIEVLRTIGNLAIYGSRGGAGVLVINTRRGEPNYSYRGFAPGIVTYSPQGYYFSREFYSPQYPSPGTAPLVPDLRTTVYWTPNILTDSTGKTAVEFYTTDEPGTYRITAEGLDGKGAVSRQVFRFEVR